jgi:hypothetical protein
VKEKDKKRQKSWRFLPSMGGDLLFPLSLVFAFEFVFFFTLSSRIPSAQFADAVRDLLFALVLLFVFRLIITGIVPVVACRFRRIALFRASLRKSAYTSYAHTKLFCPLNLYY